MALCVLAWPCLAAALNILHMEQTKDGAERPRRVVPRAGKALAGGAARFRHWGATSLQEAQRFAGRAFRRHPLLPILGPALLAALLALVLPIATPYDDRARRDADVFVDSAATALASEDLATFRNNQRWGISLQGARDEAERLEAERLARERAREEEVARLAREANRGKAAWSPELQAIGFVGVVITASERVVLLTLPTNRVERFHAGDVLEDGRRLASISAQALVLQYEDGERQTLPLFPPPLTAAADVLIADAENPPTEGE